MGTQLFNLPLNSTLNIMDLSCFFNLLQDSVLNFLQSSMEVTWYLQKRWQPGSSGHMLLTVDVPQEHTAARFPVSRISLPARLTVVLALVTMIARVHLVRRVEFYCLPSFYHSIQSNDCRGSPIRTRIREAAQLI